MSTRFILLKCDGNIFCSCGFIYFYVLSWWYLQYWPCFPGTLLEEKECKYNKNFWLVDHTNLTNHHGPPELEAQTMTRNHVTRGQEHVLGEDESYAGRCLKLKSSMLTAVYETGRITGILITISSPARPSNWCQITVVFLIFYIANSIVIEKVVCVISKKHTCL